jgi:glycosyltransferase involved in cell wall biosynthesis
MRVLVLERSLSAAEFSGEQLQLTRLVAELTSLGVEVVRDTDPAVALREPFDVVHLWNLQHPAEALDALPTLARSGVPLVLTPLYCDLRRSLFAHRTQQRLVRLEGRKLARRITELSDGRLAVDGATRWEELPLPDHLLTAQRRLLGAVAGIFPRSVAEVREIAIRVGPMPDVVKVAFVAASGRVEPEAFRKSSGIEGPFALLPAARIEPGENQWLTLRTLRDLKVPVVVTGKPSHIQYEQLCRRDAAPDTRFCGRIPRELLYSAMAAATVVVQPSTVGCASLAALESAALCGNLVIGDTGSEREYFGDLAWIVAPMDFDAMRQAVRQVLLGGEEVDERKRTLQIRAQGMFSWKASAEAVLSGYQEVLARPTVPAEVAPRTAVHFRGVVAGPSELAAQGRAWLSCLEECGFSPSLEETNLGRLAVELHSGDLQLIERCAARTPRPAAATFHCVLPPHFEPDPGARANVVQTVFETTALPPGWGTALNRADAVVVVSEFNRSSFNAGGVDRDRLFTVPPPFRGDQFCGDPAPPNGMERDGGVFRWLTVCDWSLRNGLDVLLRAFAMTFTSGEAELLLKIAPHPHLSMAEIQQICTAEVSRHARFRPPTVRLIECAMDPGQLPGLFAAADGFVLPSRGEGSGRPLYPAMLMELPVVATQAGALADALPDERLGYPVRGWEVPVSEAAAEEAPVFRGQCWFEPDLEDLCARLRQVFDDPATARIRARRGRQHVLELCRPDRVATVLDRIFRRRTAPA